MFSNTISVLLHLGDDLYKASTGICNKTVKYYVLWKYEISTELLLTEFN